MLSDYSGAGIRRCLKNIYGTIASLSLAIAVLYAGYQFALLGWALRSNKPTTYKTGDVVPSSPAIRTDASHTIIIALRSTCPYCTQSLEFYKTLLADRRQRVSKTPRFVAVCFENEATCRDYLGQNDVEMDDVMTSQAAVGLRIPMTPTMILVDAEHRVKRTWEGFQGAVEQPAIRSLIQEVVRTN